MNLLRYHISHRRGVIPIVINGIAPLVVTLAVTSICLLIIIDLPKVGMTLGLVLRVRVHRKATSINFVNVVRVPDTTTAKHHSIVKFVEQVVALRILMRELRSHLIVNALVP